MAVEVLNERVIRLPQGDTGMVRFVADEPVQEADRGVFTVARRDGRPVLRKIIAPDAETNSFAMALVYEDTANLHPDSYEWSFRLVRGGKFDETGRIMEANWVSTGVLEGRMTVLAIAGGAR